MGSETQQWNIDPAHSSVEFSVKHLGVFNVKGSFGAVTGTAETTDGKPTSVSLSIDATGLTTHNDQRDGHIKSGDFFNVEQFPALEFKSTGIENTGGNEYKVTGDLTMVGKTAPITVTIEVLEPQKDPWGNLRGGTSGNGKLFRKNWGLTYNSVLESGHMMISDEVKFSFDIQATLAQA